MGGLGTTKVSGGTCDHIPSFKISRLCYYLHGLCDINISGIDKSEWLALRGTGTVITLVSVPAVGGDIGAGRTFHRDIVGS